MAHSILITQCLQNDFVKPIRRFEPMPNLLHVGFEEARRLMGSDPDSGPVARVMRWAQERPDEELLLIHLRDGHDPADPRQRAHLEHYGPHCLTGTEGAEFAFGVEAPSGRVIPVVDSPNLNDFQGTGLSDLLAPFAGTRTRVGFVGVWTEAKVTFLAYELCTRYPEFELSTCSALTASSSRAKHFYALDQLEKLLGVRVFSSVGEFVDYLGGDSDVELFTYDEAHPTLVADEGGELSEGDGKLIRYLFSDCREVRLKMLTGGFSGNVVLGTESIDQEGHVQVPHVVKIGPQELIGKERAAFERIESVLGNSAPRIADFADSGDRGAIKYRYASMGGGISTTFQRAYQGGMATAEIERVLRTVFEEQLGRLFAGAQRQRCDLLDYYEFDAKWAPSVRAKVVELVGQAGDEDVVRLTDAVSVPNVCRFYEEDLVTLPRNPGNSSWFATIHGDLNGANIILDAHGNTWLIDFFHAHRGHVLKDLVKLENDLLFIFCPIPDRATFDEAQGITDALVWVEDLSAELPEATELGLKSAELIRAWETLRLLRSFYRPLIRFDRDPLQVFIAALRYAVHTLSFDESTEWQRKWALAMAGRLAGEVARRRAGAIPLRIDWLDAIHTGPGRLGITILPGRRDYERDLDADLQVLQQEGVTHIACFASSAELHRYGVSDLLDAYRMSGFRVLHVPMVDQKVCSAEAMREVVSTLR